MRKRMLPQRSLFDDTGETGHGFPPEIQEVILQLASLMQALIEAIEAEVRNDQDQF